MVLGFGYALFSSPNTNAIMSSVSIRHLGIASSMNATMRSLGQVLSMAIAMFCFSVFIGNVAITPPVYPALLTSITVAFLIFTCLCIAGVGYRMYGVPSIILNPPVHITPGECCS